MRVDTVAVDLEVDFHNEDESGYLWTWLSAARDRSLITPDRIVDLAEHQNGTIVHIDVLPGTVEDYLDAAARATASPL